MYRTVVKWLKSFRFVQLAIFLLILIMLMPLMLENRFMMFFMEIAFLNALLVSFSASGLRQDRFAWLPFALWACSTTVGIMARYRVFQSMVHELMIISMALYALFLISCVVLILFHIFHCRKLNSEGIFAAVAAYLLVVFMFANFYSIFLVVDPQSFSPTLEFGHTNPMAGMNLEMTYFSLVTITSLGYGQVSPLNPYVKMMSGIESLLGTLYLAILVAWLLGMSLATLRERNAQRGE